MYMCSDSNQAEDPVPVDMIVPEHLTVSRTLLSTPMSKIEGREGSDSEKNIIQH